MTSVYFWICFIFCPLLLDEFLVLYFRFKTFVYVLTHTFTGHDPAKVKNILNPGLSVGEHEKYA